MNSKAKELVDKIIRDLRQKNFESAKESNTSLMDLLLETKNQDPAVEKEVVDYMKRKLERLVVNQRSLDLREDQKKMMDNFIDDITDLYYIDISSEALNKAKTKDLLGGLWDEAMGRDEVKSDLEQITVKKPKEVQPEIEAPQEVRPIQDNPTSQESPTDNEQQNQGMITAATKFVQAHGRERDGSKRELLAKLAGCNDLDTVEAVREQLKGRKGYWSKLRARAGLSRTGNMLKTVDSKVRKLNDKTNKQKQKVQKKQDGIYESGKIIKNGTSFEL